MTRAPRPPAGPPSAPRAPRKVAQAIAHTSSQALRQPPPVHTSLQPAPALHLLNKLTDENAILKMQVDKLEMELKNSRLHSKFVEEAALNIWQEELDRAREKGHQEMLNKIQSLWRSEHFGTELLIGTNKILFSRLT